jgi:cysteine desulfurase
MMANNETGCLFPIREVADLIGEKEIIFHCDAVQAYGKIDIDVNTLHIDLLTLSAHKIYGPKGCGALYSRKGIDIDSILFGGTQESSRRAGTENLTAIAGFAEAVGQVQNFSTAVDTIKKLSELFENNLKNIFEDLHINGESSPRVPGISNIYFPFIAGDSLLMNLDMHDIAASTGSACSSGSSIPSHVLKAMGFHDQRINNSLRFSFGRYTTEKEILTTIQVLKDIYKNSK